MFYSKNDICPKDNLINTFTEQPTNYIYTQTIFQMQFLNHIFSKLHFLRTGDEIIDTIIITIFQWLFITIITSISYFIGILLTNLTKYFIKKIINLKISYKNLYSKNKTIEICSKVEGKTNLLYDIVYYYLIYNVDYSNELNLEYFIYDKNKIIIQKRMPLEKTKEIIYHNTKFSFKFVKETINSNKSNKFIYKIIINFTEDNQVIIDIFLNKCIQFYKSLL